LRDSQVKQFLEKFDSQLSPPILPDTPGTYFRRIPSIQRHPDNTSNMAYSAPSSDGSFFVESEDTYPSRHVNLRDAAKMLARNKQEMIANELSRLACDEYLEDIMQHVRAMEVRFNCVAVLPHPSTPTNAFTGRDFA